MSISIRTVKEIVGFVGVVGGMVFVGLEIRQNNQLAQATAYQEVGLRAAGVWSGMLHDEETAGLLQAARDSTRWGEFNEVDWFRLRASVMSGLRAWETVELQIEAGILPADASARLGYNVNYWPYLQRVWPDVRGLLSRDFAEYVEAQFGLQESSTDRNPRER